MSAVHAKQLVDGYLGRLELELLDLPAARRQEIVEEIRDHIAEERAGIEDESDADLMNLLDRLGDPADIAAAARDGRAKAAPRSGSSVGTLEILALILTPLVWPVGVILLWASAAWTTRQKLLGTLVPPGGLTGVLFVGPALLLNPVFLTSCTGGGGSNGVVATTCTSPEWWQYALGILLIVLSLAALAAPVVVGIYLATRLRTRTVSP